MPAAVRTIEETVLPGSGARFPRVVHGEKVGHRTSGLKAGLPDGAQSASSGLHSCHRCPVDVANAKVAAVGAAEVIRGVGFDGIPDFKSVAEIVGLRAEGATTLVCVAEGLSVSVRMA
jgi:hypothetical protein